MCYHQYSQERHYAAWCSLHASLTPWVPCLEPCSFQAVLPAKIPASVPLFGCQKLLPGVRHICPLGWPPHRAICSALLLLWLKQSKLGHHFGWNSAAAELSNTEEKSPWDLQASEQLSSSCVDLAFLQHVCMLQALYKVLLFLKPTYWWLASSWTPQSLLLKSV